MSVELEGVNQEDVQYCPISKGFVMNDLSSFALGPVVGEGLVLVNAAYSKSITVAHLEGGGKVDLKRKNFWRRARKPERNIEVVSEKVMKVDGVSYDIDEWLDNNSRLWHEEWLTWSRTIALCSREDFHWTDNLGETLIYLVQGRYLTFVEWKRRSYITPLNLLPQVPAFQFLRELYEKKIPLGLVHPKGNRYGRDCIDC